VVSSQIILYGTRKWETKLGQTGKEEVGRTNTGQKEKLAGSREHAIRSSSQTNFILRRKKWEYSRHAAKGEVEVSELEG
jgi:hypothetical protein